MENKNSDEIIVKFEEVTKQYGDLIVLDKLNLDIKKNEMVSIIGPSGSGKTTVLRVLMTLEKINGGIIHLDGEKLTHMDSNGKLIEADEKYLRERRSKILKNKDEIPDIIFEGSRRAREITKNNIELIREAMNLYTSSSDYK